MRRVLAGLAGGPILAWLADPAGGPTAPPAAVDLGAEAAGKKIRRVRVVASCGPDACGLANPIVGTRLHDFYHGYPKDATEESGKALSKP